jgi:cell division control protein 24
LIKGASDKDYPYMAELTSGHEVTKRIAESVNETIRQNSNISIVAELQFRVKDWKGHHISEFGNLLLEGRFVVTKGDLNRDYEVYLFEKMILCCKEILPDKKDKRSGKSGSLLKKQHADKHISGPPKKNPLSLKGRIYVNNLTHLQKGTAEGKMRYC